MYYFVIYLLILVKFHPCPAGFTIQYITYLQNKYPNINLETELKKVYYFDMNNDVIKCVNSFKENFKSRRYHNLFTNPPHSGDGYKKSKKVINSMKKKIMDSLYYHYV